jgi:hypothetical protein
MIGCELARRKDSFNETVGNAQGIFRNAPLSMSTLEESFGRRVLVNGMVLYTPSIGTIVVE